MLALAGSAVAAGVNYMGQQDAMNAQQKANDDWVQTQRTAAAKAEAADEARRKEATASLKGAEDQLGADAQSKAQVQSQTDLTGQMLSGSPAASDSNIQLLGGEGATTSVSKDMASRVTGAAREAQGRIKALAGLTSYGGGYGGMGQASKDALTTSGEGIALANDMRGGDTKTLGITQQIQPVQYQQGSNIAGTISDKLASLAGNAFASKMKGFT